MLIPIPLQPPRQAAHAPAPQPLGQRKHKHQPLESCRPKQGNRVCVQGGGTLPCRSQIIHPLYSNPQLEVEEDEAFAQRLAARAEGSNRQDQQQRRVLLEQENKALTVRLNNELEDVRYVHIRSFPVLVRAISCPTQSPRPPPQQKTG